MKFKIALIVWFAGTTVFGQLTPPGLGSNSKMNAWFALGLDQQLDSAGKFSSMTYLGIAGQSNVDNINVFERFGILVLNEEVKFKFRPTWSVSLAASYRHQNEYEKVSPYLAAEDKFKQEFRVYSRITKSWKKKWIPSIAFRQEFRKFYNPEFRDWKVSSAFRSRLKFQSEFALSRNKRFSVIAGCEFLFSTEFQEKTQEWKHFEYGETRLSAVLTYKSKNGKWMYGIGYMDDLLHVDAGEKSVNYITLSLILNNIF
ncbi:hypothetical protein D3C87_228270 [compost metagenome]